MAKKVKTSKGSGKTAVAEKPAKKKEASTRAPSVASMSKEEKARQISRLIKELKVATDPVTKRNIRSRLRALGHTGGLKGAGIEVPRAGKKGGKSKKAAKVEEDEDEEEEEDEDLEDEDAEELDEEDEDDDVEPDDDDEDEDEDDDD